MTEHRNIPLPSSEDAPNGKAAERAGDPSFGKDQETRRPAGASLFERASGQFGLDPFKPAAPRRSLADLPTATPKRARRAAPKVVARTPAAVSAQVSTIRPQRDFAAAPAEPTGEPVRFPAQVQHVDRQHLAEQGFIEPGGEASTLLEEFRIAKRQLLSSARALGTDRSRIVLVTSPLPGEGKTFCSVNLAIAMAAERNAEILLIDGDVAKPSISRSFGFEAGRGLMDALADPEVRVEDLVIRTDIDGLFVLPAGSAGLDETDLLASDRMALTFGRLTENAANRMIIVDSPPTLAASPAAEFAKHAGQTVLVARADRTGRNALEDACHLLSACADIKLLLNGADFSPSGRRFGTYHADMD
ncbi:AAA family ATPase [Pseudopontixanthobacter vadosimaris]|uniref:AAA family ATPase n=1 Tax=Pseudopontixanthobacter vadosimaris TaxID=2726450 RepID=UPI0014757777|nr:AAA family ATPase [Pseudopontixanthobacter vadosimaris]